MRISVNGISIIKTTTWPFQYSASGILARFFRYFVLSMQAVFMLTVVMIAGPVFVLHRCGRLRTRHGFIGVRKCFPIGIPVIRALGHGAMRGRSARSIAMLMRRVCSLFGHRLLAVRAPGR